MKITSIYFGREEGSELKLLECGAEEESAEEKDDREQEDVRYIVATAPLQLSIQSKLKIFA